MADTLVIPTDAVELQEMLTDKTVMRTLAADPEKMAEFLNNSVNARLENDPGILSQVKLSIFVNLGLRNLLLPIYSSALLSSG